MRSSSIKSLVITAATVVAITLTTVPATARPFAQSTQPVASAKQARDNGAFAKIKRLYNRFMGPVLNGTFSIPIPAPVTGTNTSTSTSTSPSSSNDN